MSKLDYPEQPDAQVYGIWQNNKSAASEASQSASTRSSAFQEGADTAILHQAPINPYRRAMRALTDPESLATLGKLAQEWEDGYVSNCK